MAQAARGVKLALIAMMGLLLVACGDVPTASKPAPEPLGDFKLGIAVVVADNAEKGPLSRDVSEAELETALLTELKRVFGAYDGDKFYNIAVSVDAYVLAVPGIPLVFSPKSALVVSLNVWDDSKGERITEEHKQFTILERITGSSLLLGSGMTQSREEQLAELTRLAVTRIEKYLRENIEVFGPYKSVPDES